MAHSTATSANHSRSAEIGSIPPKGVEDGVGMETVPGYTQRDPRCIMFDGLFQPTHLIILLAILLLLLGPRSCLGWGGRWGRRFGSSRSPWRRRGRRRRRRPRATRKSKKKSVHCRPPRFHPRLPCACSFSI